MRDILVHLRLMQLFTHGAHNFCARTPFFSDHEFFNQTYLGLEEDYDSVIERMIGLFGEDSIQYLTLHSEVCEKLSHLPSIGVKENYDFFQALLLLEHELCLKVKDYITQDCTAGTEQLLGEICNKSEIRQYKEKQRTKK